MRILGVISPNIWLIGMEDKKIRKPSDPMEFEDLPWGINILRQHGKGASIKGRSVKGVLDTAKLHETPTNTSKIC